MIKYLLSIGALEYSFTDDDGEPVYRFTENARNLVPDIYEEQMEDFSAIIFELWNKGVIEIFFDEDGDPIIGLNEKTNDPSVFSNLDKEQKQALKEILEFWDHIEEE